MALSFGGTSVAAQVPGSNLSYAPQQNQAYADQTAARTNAEQMRLMQEEALRNQLLAQSRAADKLQMEMNNPANSFSTNGTSLTVSNGGAGSGGSGSGGRVGGVNIGGGTFPDVNALLSQFDTLSSKFSPVRPPGLPAGPTVPSTVNAFAAGKDVSGRMGNKAIEALRNSMTRRGISDSGLAAAGEASILSDVANQQSQNVYDAQKLDTGRQWDANQISYAGALQNNGQIFQGELANQNVKLDILRSLMSRLY
jgi:hypothetical protein